MADNEQQQAAPVERENRRRERGRGFGRGRGGRGRGNRRGARNGKQEWVPVTKVGRLVKAGLIKSLEEIFLFSLPIKEYQIIDHFIPKEKLRDENVKVMSVQKQTAAGQRTRFKAFVIIGDMDGHVGLGVKCAKEVANAVEGATIQAKLSIIPVRRGYWGNKFGLPHTVCNCMTGKCGSVRVRLVPAPRGAGIVAAPIPKKVLTYAGIEDVFTSSRGCTKTLGNFIMATFNAVKQSYGFLSPDLWKENLFLKTPYEEHSEFLKGKGKSFY